MTKQCSKCKTVKSRTDYNIKKSTKDGLAYHCKSCEKEAHRKHYQSNKSDYISRAKQRLRQNTILYKKWREGLICSICNETDWHCIELHHIDPTLKEFDIGGSTGHSINSPKFKKELSKCIIVCANCHKKIHAYGLDKVKYDALT